MKAYKRVGEDEFEEIEVKPECITLCKDFDRLCICPTCGKVMKYGDTYASSFIFDKRHVSYAVCKDCKEKERAIKEEYYRSKGF